MATNRIFAPTNRLTVAASLLTGGTGTAGAVQSGDFLIFGDAAVPCVAIIDQDADDEVTVEFGQHFVVYDLSVTGANDVGNTAIAAGDVIQFDGGTLNVDATNGSAYGTALEAVASGATTTIRVAVGLGA